MQYAMWQIVLLINQRNSRERYLRTVTRVSASTTTTTIQQETDAITYQVGVTNYLAVLCRCVSTQPKVV